MKIEKLIAVIGGKRYELKRESSCLKCALNEKCGLKGVPHDGDLTPCIFNLYSYKEVKEEAK